MIWNWQQEDWLNFSYNANDFRRYEHDFQHKAGVMAGSIKYITANDQDLVEIGALKKAGECKQIRYYLREY
jgi:hypothetical protein